MCQEDLDKIGKLPDECALEKHNSLISWRKNRAILKKTREFTKDNLAQLPFGHTMNAVKVYNRSLIQLLKFITNQCTNVMSQDIPFAYAMLITGSTAMREACPYSDIEYAFLAQASADDRLLAQYFLGWFELAICAMGEIPHIPLKKIE